jgi:thermitase
MRLKTRIFSLAIIVFLAAAPVMLRIGNSCILKLGDLALMARADGNNFVNGEVVVELKPRRNAGDVAARHNMTVLEDLEDDTYLFGILDSRTVEEAVAELKADHRDVRSAEPNYLLKVPEVDQRSVAWVDQRSVAWVDGESPPEYFDQYAMQLIRATEAQESADGSGVTVAVIDTGVDTDHPTFDNVVQGYDYVSHDNNPAEEGSGPAYGHGTMVAGIVALVAPRATVMPVRAFDSNGIGTAANVGNAIRYAARNGADVINMSFGVSTESAPIRSAIEFASRQGAVLIVAAGNSNTSVPQYPASDEDVLAVGATDNADNKADFSNYGSHIAVGAPGVSIYSAYPGGRFAWGDGTSYATAFVSGEAALVLSVGGGDADQIIRDTAVPCCGGLLGNGRIDALAAVSR